MKPSNRLGPIRQGWLSVQRYSIQIAYCALLLLAVWFFTVVALSQDYS